jgi:acetate kinase
VKVLCVNAGSSSLKLALFEGERRVAGAQVHGNGRQDLDDAIAKLGASSPDAIGHRLVHGGPVHHLPSRLDQRLLHELRGIVQFAPLHLPPALDAVEAMGARFPGVPQVACFDTHFHWNLPERSRRLPIPEALHAEGVRRYGFHGLSYEFIVSELGARLGRRAVVAHLGNGASLAALDSGRCVDTTMAFTPASGVVMGTRPGDLDPGVLLYWMAKGASAAEVQHLVDRECGLRGISGGTSDMKTLLDQRERDARSALALEIFVHSCRKAVGALAAVLGGLDTFVLTGGIGENAPEVRAEICEGLTHLGVRLDPEANQAASERISAAGSRCTVLAIRTDEDRMIARHVRELLGEVSR